MFLRDRRQPYLKEAGRKQVGGPIRPFDDAKAVAAKVLIQADLGNLQRTVQSVKVDMVNVQTIGVLRDHHERGTSSKVFGAQALKNPLGQASLARAQVTKEKKHLTGLGLLS